MRRKRMLRSFATLAVAALTLALASSRTLAQGPARPAVGSRTTRNAIPTVPTACPRPITFRTAQSGHFVCAEGGGGSRVVADRAVAGPWETFQVIDLDCGELANGDRVQLKAMNGNFVCAEGGGGAELKADRTAAAEWETFTLVIEGGGVLRTGAVVSLQSWNGKFVVAEGGGGGVVLANRDAIGPWEKFVVVLPFSSAPTPVVGAPEAAGLGLLSPSTPEVLAEIEAIRDVMQPLESAEAEFVRSVQTREGAGEGAGSSLPLLRMRSRTGDASAAAFDWMRLIPDWPTKDQGACNSSFVFAAAGAFEASHYIRNEERVSVSEQSLLDRSNPRFTCETGGWITDPLGQLMLMGAASEDEYPYQRAKQVIRREVARPYRAMAWGFVGTTAAPSRAQIKQELLVRGPLIMAVHGDGRLRTISPARAGESNHAVVLVGWDDLRGAWKVRNSWKNWGESGYGWVDYLPDGEGCPVLWVAAQTRSFHPREPKLPPACETLLATAAPLRACRSALTGAGMLAGELHSALGVVVADLDGLAAESTRSASMSRLGEDGAMALRQATVAYAQARRMPARAPLLASLRSTFLAARNTFAQASRCEKAFGPNRSGSGALFKFASGFRARLDEGSAITTPDGPVISGTVSVWHESRPGTRLVFRDAALALRGTPGEWTELEGIGTLALVDGGSSQVLGESSLKWASPSQEASGRVRITRFNHTVDLDFLAGASGVRGNASWNGGDAGWKPLPRSSGAEFHVVEPRLEFDFENGRLATRLCCRKVEVRTIARNPAADNRPWASFEVNPPCLEAQNDAVIDLMGRQFEALGDPNAPKRVACELLCPGLIAPPPGSRPLVAGPARDAYDKAAALFDEARRKHEACVAACLTSHPRPPVLPVLPGSITIRIEVVIQ